MPPGHVRQAELARIAQVFRPKLLDGRRMTCYPSFRDSFPDSAYTETDVVQDGNIVTGSIHSGAGPRFFCSEHTGRKDQQDC